MARTIVLGSEISKFGMVDFLMKFCIVEILKVMIVVWGVNICRSDGFEVLDHVTFAAMRNSGAIIKAP